MNNKPQPFLVVEKGDNLWKIAANTFGLASNSDIAAKVKTLVQLNPHIKNPEIIREGQIIYLGSQTGIETFSPSTVDLKEMESYFSDVPTIDRNFLTDNWEVISAFGDEDNEFLNHVGIGPQALKNSLASAAPIEISDSVFSPMVPIAYKVGKAAAKTGALALNGKFGNFLKVSPFVWRQVEGELVRGLKTQARYLKNANGVLNLIPKNARAFNMNGKVILVNPKGTDFLKFSKQVAQGEAIAKGLKITGTLTKFFDFGIGVKNVHEKWDTPEREKTIAVESSKFGASFAWGLGSEAAATGICGGLSLTTGPGGLACFGTVFVGGSFAASELGSKIGNWIFSIYHGSKLESYFNDKDQINSQIPWLYKGDPQTLLGI